MTASLINLTCAHYAQYTHLVATVHGMDKVFISGGFCNDPLTRYCFTKFWHPRTMFGTVSMAWLCFSGLQAMACGLEKQNLAEGNMSNSCLALESITLLYSIQMCYCHISALSANYYQRHISKELGLFIKANVGVILRW